MVYKYTKKIYAALNEHEYEHLLDPELHILREELHDRVPSADRHDFNIPKEKRLNR